MEDLRKAFEGLKFKGVKTYIASGNVIFNSPEKDKARLVQLTERKLSEEFKTDLRLVIVTLKEYEGIIKNAPAGFGRDSQNFRYDVWFLKEPLTKEEVLLQVKPREGVDTIYGGKGAIYTSRLTDMMGKSHLIKVNKLPIYQNITVRSWNTTVKLFELMRAVKNLDH
jgi:uncharacterized protein (DUF1697 family)